MFPCFLRHVIPTLQSNLPGCRLIRKKITFPNLLHKYSYYRWTKQLFVVKKLSRSGQLSILRPSPRMYAQCNAIMSPICPFEGKPQNSSLAANPFSDAQTQQRPVFNTPAPKPTINEMKQASFAQFTVPTSTAYSGFGVTMSGGGHSSGGATGQPAPDPWTPVPTNNQLGAPWMKSSEPANPFLS
jgi:hypothetical protein